LTLPAVLTLRARRGLAVALERIAADNPSAAAHAAIPMAGGTLATTGNCRTRLRAETDNTRHAYYRAGVRLVRQPGLPARPEDVAAFTVAQR
jgi:hypothetical protein